MQQLYEALKTRGCVLEESDVEEFIKTVLEMNVDKDLSNIIINQLIWKIRVHPYNIQSDKNNNKLSQYLFRLEDDEFVKT